MSTHDGAAGCESAHASIGHTGGVAPFHHGAADLEGFEALLHGVERNLGGELGSLLDGGGASGLVLVGLLGQTEGIHNFVEGVGVFINEVQQFGLQSLTLHGHVAEFLPLIIVGSLAAGEVGDHGAERSGEGTHVGTHAAAAGSGALAGGLVTEACAGEVDELLLALVLDKKFDNLLLGIERLEVVETHALDGHLHNLVLADAETALLFGKIIFTGIDEDALGDEADDFAASNTETAVSGAAAHLVEAQVHGCHLDGSDVHRDLGDAIVLDIPADSLGAFQRAGNHDGLAVLVFDNLAAGLAAFALGTAFLADVEGDGVGTAGAGAVEVVVDSHEEVACADLGCASLSHIVVPLIGAEIGFPLLGAEAGVQALIFARAAIGEVATLGDVGCALVAVDGDVELFAQTFAQLVSILHHLVHSDVADGDEGADIGSALTGMSAMVVAHVDEFGSLLHHAESGFASLLGLAHESDDSTVGRCAGIDVKQFHTFNLLNLGSHLIDDIHVATFANIGHAFDKLFHNI